MDSCIMRQEAFAELFRLIFKVLGKPMSFQNLEGNIPSDATRQIRYAAYCTDRCRERAFANRCRVCDAEGLRVAMAKRDAHAYICHGGLIDCAVPFFDHAGRFLGGFLIGQVRPRGAPPPRDATAAQRRLYRQLQESTIDEMADIGRLVRFFGSHLVDNEILRHRTASWVTGVEKYLSQHADECVTLSDVAHAIGRSVSFLSHRFRPAFGVSFKQYQLDRRMRQARELLASGLSVKATAARMGFSDAFNFSRAFKRHWGAPPRAYRAGALLPHDRPVSAQQEQQSD